MAVVRYIVPDVDAAVGFYTELLGFELEQRFGPAFAIVTRADLSLWLSGPQSSAARPMPDGRSPEPGGWNRLVVEVDDLAGTVAGLQQAGLIRHLGISSVRAEHLTQARAIAPVAAVSNRYAVDFGRVNDDLLDSCREQGIAFVPYFALTGEGREVGGLASHDLVSEVARAHGSTAAQVRLAWALSRGPHVLVIPGTSSESHLVENLAAADLELSAAELEALTALG